MLSSYTTRQVYALPKEGSFVIILFSVLYSDLILCVSKHFLSEQIPVANSKRYCLEFGCVGVEKPASV